MSGVVDGDTSRRAEVAVSMPAYPILFVDGDPSAMHALTDYFENLGHEVFTAETGEEGLSLHERAHPLVTVLDLEMPGMSGMEVLEILRERQASVIMLAGKGDIEAAVQAMRLGAENFLVKPIDPEHLSIAVERIAEKTTLRQENAELKRRFHPNLRRRLIRFALLVLLAAVSAGLGMLIGGGGGGNQPRSPAPIPVDSVG